MYPYTYLMSHHHHPPLTSPSPSLYIINTLPLHHHHPPFTSPPPSLYITDIATCLYYDKETRKLFVGLNNGNVVVSSVTTSLIAYLYLPHRNLIVLSYKQILIKCVYIYIYKYVCYFRSSMWKKILIQ